MLKFFNGHFAVFCCEYGYKNPLEVRGMWVFPPGETPGARKVGVSPGETGVTRKMGVPPDEMNYCVLDDYCINSV